MKKIIVANWKMNPAGLRQAQDIFNKIDSGVKVTANADVVICPPFPYLSLFKSSSLKFGAQNLFFEEKGAYTGEISPLMLKDLGVEYVILGHSERRKHFKESDDLVNKKMKAALKAGLKPILCVDKISQVEKGLKGVSGKKFMVAYEPLFAIGTGNPCSPEKAEKMRLAVEKKTGKGVPVLYGGSVNGKNALYYLKEAGFQGLLVGGASLKPEEFVDIVKSACYFA